MQVMRVLSVSLLLFLVAGIPVRTALAQGNADADAAYADMEKTMGMVPTFMKAFPKVGISSAWGEMKAVQMNPGTELSGKMKELVGLAVAAQIPCEYCVYFHTMAAKANGATDEEIREAVAMAAITRHWSTVLNGSQIDFEAFKQEADQILAHAMKMAESEGMK